MPEEDAFHARSFNALLVFEFFFYGFSISEDSKLQAAAFSQQEQIKIGSAEVRAIFSSGSGRVAGCMVTEGKVVEDSGIRVLRKGKTVHVGILNSLRRVKENVKEV